jgi:hypothetical protein
MEMRLNFHDDHRKQKYSGRALFQKSGIEGKVQTSFVVRSIQDEYATECCLLANKCSYTNAAQVTRKKINPALKINPANVNESG